MVHRQKRLSVAIVHRGDDIKAGGLPEEPLDQFFVHKRHVAGGDETHRITRCLHAGIQAHQRPLAVLVIEHNVHVGIVITSLSIADYDYLVEPDTETIILMLKDGL